MFGSVITWLQQTCSTDPAAFTVLSLMCMVGAYMTKDAMTNPNGAFLIYPLLVMCSVLVNWGLAQLGYFEMKQMDQWLVAVVTSGTLGMVIGLSLFLYLTRAWHAIVDRYHRPAAAPPSTLPQRRF